MELFIVKLRPNSQIFLNLVSNELQIILGTVLHENLTKEQRQALSKLSKIKNVIIKTLDKDGNVIDSRQCIDSCMILIVSNDPQSSFPIQDTAE